MSIDSRWLVYRFLLEVWAGGRTDGLPLLVTPDFSFWPAAHDQPYSGTAKLEQWLHGLHQAIPDWDLEIVDTVVSACDAAVRWRARGTHDGAPLDTVAGRLEITHRPFVLEGMAWFELQNGRIRQWAISEDTLGWFRQLGLTAGTAPVEKINSDQLLVMGSRYFMELMNQGQLHLIAELMSPEIRFHIPTLPQPIVGHEGMKLFVGNLRRAFPDLTFSPYRWTQQGSKVAARWNLRGTHLGEFLGHPPTANPIVDRGITVFSFVDGQIANIHVNQNHYGLFQQLRGEKGLK